MPPRTVVVALALAACTPESLPETLAPSPDVAPSPPVLRRLTQAQYENAVADLFGAGVFVPTNLDSALRLDGLEAIGAAAVAISPRGVERYETAAYVVADAAVAADRRDGWMPCAPAGAVDAACAALAVETLGRRAWRRPLAQDEIDALTGVATGAADVLGDFWQGLSFAVAGLLQAPDFLMRPELGDGEGRYTGYEMASRLSFLLWNSIPDDALLDAAEAGVLDTQDGIDAEVQRLLASPRARVGLRAWVADLLELSRLGEVQKDPTVFVQWSDGLLDSAAEETLRLFEDRVFDIDGDVRDVLTTRRTFVDRTLARLYDVRAPARDGFGVVEFAEDAPRVGLLGHASLLAMHAHPTSTSVTLRGKFVRQKLLCAAALAPPAGVDTSIPEPSPDAPTMRERVAVHLENPSCAGCHSLMDPIGLGLEQFDGLGGFRTTENGATIDPSGDLDGATFADAASLAKTLRAHDDLVPCLVDQVARYALGRTVADGDAEAFAWLVDRFTLYDHRIQPLWMELVTNPLFRRVGEVE